MMPPKVLLLIPKFATPHDGELVATRDAIARLLLAAGLDWHDLAKACMSTAGTPTTRASGQASFGDLARAARDLDRGRLTPRERAFVTNMVRRGFAFRPSPRQADWLDDILSCLEGRAAA